MYDQLPINIFLHLLLIYLIKCINNDLIKYRIINNNNHEIVRVVLPADNRKLASTII